MQLLNVDESPLGFDQPPQQRERRAVLDGVDDPVEPDSWRPRPESAVDAGGGRWLRFRFALNDRPARG